MPLNKETKPCSLSGKYPRERYEPPYPPSKYPRERYEPPYPPSYGLNSTTTALQGE